MERDWKKKRIEAYKTFGKEFRKTLPKTEDNIPKPPRSAWLMLALSEYLIDRYGEDFGDFM